MICELRPFQRKGVRKIDHFGGRALLADEMGLGKTIQSLAWYYNYRKRHKKAPPAIVICEAGLKWQWEDEAKRHFNMRSIVFEGLKPPRRLLINPPPLLIINYEILHRWTRYLRQIGFCLLIVDEGQKIKNKSTKRAKAVRRLNKHCDHLLILSGTPFENRPAEFFNTLNLLRPDVFPSFQEFAMRHCQPKRKPWGWEFKGAVRLKELHITATSTCMIRRRKKDVLKELPEQQRSIVLLDIENRKEYNHALKDFIGWLSRINRSKAKKAQRAERLVRWGYLKRLIARLKLRSVMHWIDTFLEESDEKLIVFACHKIVLRTLCERYTQGLLIDGSVKGKHRRRVVDRFTHDKRKRLLFGNIDAAGKGLNLVAASTTATIELAWKPAAHEQADARVHRMGQKRHTSHYYLIAANTIEVKLCSALQSKGSHVSQVLDGDDADAFDIYDELEKELLRR